MYINPNNADQWEKLEHEWRKQVAIIISTFSPSAFITLCVRDRVCRHHPPGIGIIDSNE